jgi:hypothetical protein
MTQEEWLDFCDNMPYTFTFPCEVSQRKARLFAVGCCRCIWHLLTKTCSRSTIENAERFADRMFEQADLSQSRGEHSNYRRSQLRSAIYHDALLCGYGLAEAERRADCWSAAWDAVDHLIHTDARDAARMCFGWVRLALNKEMSVRSSRSKLRAMLDDVFGNLFRRVALDPHWLTSTVVDLARSIYQHDPRQAGGYMSGLPILADALMDAGCDDEQILGHCLGPGPHVRGCWILDLLLGKE